MGLSPRAFYGAMAARGLDFYAGVPDSLLKAFCAYVADHTPAERNIIAANEGCAVGLAAGYHFATGKTGVVYLQNSGLGNIINPVTSLADPAVYGVPMLLVVGWRGEPGKKDEPQHGSMGRYTPAVLDGVDVPYAVLPEEPAEAEAVLDRAVASMTERSGPFAILVRKGTFDSYTLQSKTPQTAPLSREAALNQLLDAVPPRTALVSTTGMLSRELFELRVARKEGHAADFLTVGSMGHASQIALGAALGRPDRAVWCLDGDGAALMHLGGLTTIGTLAPASFKHVVFNNGAHDSVGGQPTVGHHVDLCALATASGYRAAYRADDAEALATQLEALDAAEGPALLEIRIRIGARGDLGRPTIGPAESKRQFMEFLGS